MLDKKAYLVDPTRDFTSGGEAFPLIKIPMGSTVTEIRSSLVFNAACKARVK